MQLYRGFRFKPRLSDGLTATDLPCSQPFFEVPLGNFRMEKFILRYLSNNFDISKLVLIYLVIYIHVLLITYISSKGLF